MKLTLIIAYILSPIIGISQTDSETTYKNDIAISYGANLNNFGRKIPGLEYRRALNENWKLKVGIMGDRNYSESKLVTRTSFDISDSSIIRRAQFLTYRATQTIRVGADFTHFEHFSFGAQLIFGRGFGDSYASDQVFYDNSSEGDHPYYVYSDELTEDYHGGPYFGPAGGLPETGQRTEVVSYLNYWVYGLGLTAEAKWPIGNRFEAALQYNPECLYFMPRSQFDIFELDENVTREFNDILDFNHLLNLFVRFKF